MCSLDNYISGYTHIKSRDVKRARKARWCDECGRTIKIGTPYAYSAGVYEGDFCSSALCPRCKLAGEWLQNRGHGYIIGEIRADVVYCAEEEIAERREKTKA